MYQGDGTEFTCTGLRRVTGYTFRLSASNEKGAGPHSTTSTYHTLPDPPGQCCHCVHLNIIVNCWFVCVSVLEGTCLTILLPRLSHTRHPLIPTLTPPRPHTHTITGTPEAPYLKERARSSSLHLTWLPPADSGGTPINTYLLQVCHGLSLLPLLLSSPLPSLFLLPHLPHLPHLPPLFSLTFSHPFPVPLLLSLRLSLLSSSHVVGG